MVNVGGRKNQEKRILFVFAYPLHRFFRELGSHFAIFVKGVSRISPTDIVEFSLFRKDFCVGRLAVDERIFWNQSDYPMILYIHKRWVAVHNRHAEVVVKSEF